MNPDNSVAGLAKVLFIGVDAGDKDLILRWSAEGRLPNFARLLGTAAWGLTESPTALYVGAIWPSFYTALSPARHGRYCYEQFQPGSYVFERVPPQAVKAAPFWDSLSHAGKRVAVIDVPKTFPSQLRDGLHIVDWGSHDPDRAGFCVSPVAMETEIVEKFGVETIHDCNAFRTTGEQYRDFRDHLVDRVNRKSALSAHYLDQGNWDCFLTVFSESHCVGHQCWHLHDEQHQKYDPGFVAVAGDPICDVYQAIDRGIGELIQQAGDDTHTVVFASHGMGPHYDASFMLDDILCRLEDRRPRPVRSALAAVVPRWWQRLPRAVRNLAVRPLRDKVRASLGVDAAGGRAGRRCFKVPNNDAWGGIRVNLIGREPRGRVAAGKDYDEYCAALSRDLMAFVNVTSGEPLVKRVERSADLYDGDYLDHLPDLLVEWNRSAPVSEVYSPKTGRFSGEYRKCRTGDHTDKGLFFVSGPGVTPGQVQAPVSVTDLAPTLAALTGVELADVDGRSIGPLIGLDRQSGTDQPEAVAPVE